MKARAFAVALLGAMLAGAPLHAQAPAAEPRAAIVREFVGVAPGGPPWWKVSKGGATVWVLGLPTGRATRNPRWNTAPFRAALTGARVLVTPYSPWSRVGADNKPFNALPRELGQRVVAAAVRIRQPPRNREPTLTDAVTVHGAFYFTSKLADNPPPEIADLARRLKIRVITAPQRQGTPLATLPTDGPQVAACVEAMLADMATPPAASAAATSAWAAGDVAGALAAPPNVRWACEVLWPGWRERSIGFTTEAIAFALDMPGKVVAVADIDQLVTEDGVLSRLRARGFQVSGPMQPTGQ